MFDRIAFLQIFVLYLCFAKLHRVRSLEWRCGVMVKHALHKQLEQGLFPMAIPLKGVMVLPQDLCLYVIEAGWGLMSPSPFHEGMLETLALR